MTLNIYDMTYVMLRYYMIYF